MFPIVDASRWEVEGVEPGGQDPGSWLIDPTGGRWLFKPVVVRDGRRQGEDWAEKIASELAQLIGLPGAAVEMAVRDSASGCLSGDLKPGPGWQMHTGAVLISEVDPRLTVRSKDRIGHNLDNISVVLDSVEVPVGWPSLPSWMGAFDVFCGFLMFDAWIANLDRHEENWSVLQGPDGTRHLAPSYDHGNSLGFNLLDRKRAEILGGNPTLAWWAARAMAGRFENGERVSLVDHATNALARVGADAGTFWRERIASIAPEEIEQIVKGRSRNVGPCAYIFVTVTGDQPWEASDMTAQVTLVLPDLRARSVAQAGGRRLMVTWQDTETRRYHQVGWLTLDVNGSYEYAYLPTTTHLERFHPFVGFRNLEETYRSTRLFPFFAQRLLSPNRPDLPRLLSALALDNDRAVEPVEFLARSGGRRGGDTVELLPEPIVELDGSTCWLFLVHGIRHLPGAGEVIDRLQTGDVLDLASQAANPVNPDALLVTRAGDELGWVPDPLLKYLRTIISPRLEVIRANPADLGHHLRLLVQVSGTVGGHLGHASL